ncbi:DNA cytosine methyltransferase [Candidatus Woesearchaeota archaeon]|nr:DNA cytosine methyltransferase [Candidatus Woesearchaeota archaeon]
MKAKKKSKGVSKEKQTFTSIDLFAGVGGMRLGFEQAGFKTLFANDFNKDCKTTYDFNFTEPKLYVDDLWKVDIKGLPSFDVLVGGFPCQAFSIAGYQKGFKDIRGNLFFRLAEILKEKKPRAFLLENVKNLKSHDEGRTFKIIEKTLKHLGYHTKDKILNSMTHGNTPQNRERIFIVGFLKEDDAEGFEFPDQIPLTKSFREFVAEKADAKYYYNDKPLYEKIKKEISSEHTVYQWRRKYVRANKKRVVPTLTANMGRGGHNVPLIKNSVGIRKLTPRECFLLQGFPKDFGIPKDLSDSELYHQAGNSVTVPVVRRIAENIHNVLEGKRLNQQMTIRTSTRAPRF